ncbi:putative fungal specific transcription protein [Zalerion maritima]|uniref:Fungal specific transcription protein n=1 Tax=Zalerion maritima TaxID=339359 RepID=A0AAD5RVS9_9PEZI|nr:putative fungal specific transcription protein [Zalerion maritima]
MTSISAPISKKTHRASACRMDADNLDPRLRGGPDPTQDTAKPQSSAQSQPNATNTDQPPHSTAPLSLTGPTAVSPAPAPRPAAIHADSSTLVSADSITAKDGLAHHVAAITIAGLQQQQQQQQQQPHGSSVPTSISPTAAPSTSTTTSQGPSATLQPLAPGNSYYPSTPSTTAAAASANEYYRSTLGTLPQQHSPETPHNAPLTPGQHQAASSIHGGGILGHGGDKGGTPGSADQKRTRACEACRSLKVRCDAADPANPDASGPCKRCSKAGRQCIVTAPTRKRQKKPDSRVAELEKKIDALTASLNANRGTASGVSPPAYAAPSASHTHPAVNAASASPDVVMGGVGGGGGTDGRLTSSGQSYPKSTTPSATPWAAAQPPPTAAGQESSRTTPFNTSSMVAAGLKRKLAEAMPNAPDGSSAPPTTSSIPLPLRPGQIEHNFSDIVDRGIITMEKAAELWDRYVNLMVPNLPAVVFPPETTVADVRKNKPALFLAIMASATAEMPTVQKVLIKELMQMFAHKIIIVGEKYLELIQALHIAVIWYYPPDHFEELKFYQLVHMSAVMAIDIGLGRKKPMAGKRMAPYTWRDHPYRKHPFPDPTTIECRRAWLTCYFLASNTSMALHRPNLVRWTKFMSESFDILRTSPEASPSDEYFCHLVWTHKLSEEIGLQFELDDPTKAVNIVDSRTQHALRGFEYDLEKYSNSIPPELRQPSLRLSFHVVSLYMHEIALHGEKDEMIRPPMTRSGGTLTGLFGENSLTSHHIRALSACLTAIDGIFDTFLSMETTSIRCLPVFNYVRVAYAVVVLIKLYFAASAPESELGRVIDKDNMKVEHYLNALLEKFKATAAEDRSRPAAKFLLVLVMLKTWFHSRGKCSLKQQEGVPIPFPSQSIGGQNQQQGQQTQQRPYQQQQQKQAQQSQPPQSRPQQDFSATANTPLQLLSEVATNDPSCSQTQTTDATTTSTQAPIFPSGSNSWSPAQHMFPDGMRSAAEQPSGVAVAGPSPGPGDFSTSGMTVPGTGPANTVASQVAAAVSANNLLGGQAQQQGYAMPWLNPAFNADLVDYSGLMGDGWEEAMTLTLAGLGDGIAIGMGANDGAGVVSGLNLDLTQLGIPDGAVGNGFF